MKQQIVISGFGGQGVVFLTKLVTEAALLKNLSVFASETHGMAQRGGNVVSYIKIYDPLSNTHKFWSPLIRPGNADLLISLHPEAIPPYLHLLKEGGIIICNESTVKGNSPNYTKENIIFFNANTPALRLGNHRMANVVLLGFAASRGYLFCSLEDLISVAKGSENPGLIEALGAGVQ
ncbi:MAG: 2-oxoacid:acceptor oxidoreductase family protein [Syntrophobacterales bacterium]|nr:2-oxoacid:acceptor oxidoreductase family protein [Syntrophobacterales bacterium]